MTELLDFFRETGKQGGKIGGKKRAANLSSKELSAIGKKGAAARWKFKASLGGHAPGHIRDAFCEALDGVNLRNFDPLAAIEKHLADDEAIVFFDKRQAAKWAKMASTQRAQWLLGQLWNCTDILGSEICGILDLHAGSSYAVAARKIRGDSK